MAICMKYGAITAKAVVELRFTIGACVVGFLVALCSKLTHF